MACRSEAPDLTGSVSVIINYTEKIEANIERN